MKEYKNLTIFFVSYFSKKFIEKIIKKIDQKINIIIVDNANEKGFKNYFENKHGNVKVIVSKKNNGQTGGINIGFKNIKTKYAIYMDSDIKFNPKIINNFISVAKEIEDFIILAPQHEKNTYKKDFFSSRPNKFKKYNLMKLVHGQFLFFNMKNVRKVGKYDEKIFLYYDETDFCLRAYRKNQKIYVLPKIKVKHQGGMSVDISNKLSIEANKNWHYMWSKFYYFRKNYSLIYAYKKTILILLMSFLKFIFFSFLNKRKRVIYYNQISGLTNSYMGYKSNKRLKV